MAGGGYRGTQGRKPKASTISERERQKGKGAEPPAAKLPAAPRHLSKEAKKEWRRLVKQLVEAGLWKDIFTDSVAMYCTAHVQYCRAKAMLEGPPGFCPNCEPGAETGLSACRPPSHRLVEYGEVIRGRFGVPMDSPYIKRKKEAETLMVRLNGEFGMTLASHSRLPASKPAEKSRPQPRSTDQPSSDPRDLLKMQVMASNS